MLTAIFMTVSGKMTKHTASESILIPMELNTRDIGSMTSNMVKERKSGLMVLNTKEIINLVKRTASESFCGLTDPPMRVTF